ncbi:dnaJ homolog subfamily C member 21 [Sitophilus oryzae]|uniref:DnaJ homolog subfamily C member 21 n=1 Tax=Sitophilus oryzae TaxID=7048 RepID=A0A6J2X2G2_SITOR|nr:dnaJ homolog subfamily C member 21 [Sitophilus oryzae]
MKCHYEILQISKEADDSEIKNAYRKLALKWHPDKNLEQPVIAKEQFQLVQQAYEVLGDKQERAWYDAHRDQILRGISSEFQDKSLDVFQYFTTTCFKGYNEEKNGFFAVYRQVFEQIAKEDIEFMDDKEDFVEIPGFGKSDSDYETVVKPFYDFWMSYSTKKSYSWLDPYDIREGKGDRRLLKVIEKENKKVRQKARKDRNEEIRSLVSFVRKRDKRVQAYKKEMEDKAIENRKKQEKISKQRRIERKQQQANEKQADWMKFENVQSQLEEMEKHLAEQFGEDISNSEEEIEDVTNLYCVACNKVFKTAKAFENHESSKKHRENVERLKQTMLEDDIESNLTGNVDEYQDIIQSDEDLEDIIDEKDSESDEDSVEQKDCINEIGHTKQKQYNEYSSTENLASNSKNDNSKKKQKQNKKSRTVLTNVQDSDEDLDVLKVSDDDFDFGMSKSQKKKNIKKTNLNKIKPTKDMLTETQSGDVEVKITVPKKLGKKNRKKDVATGLSEIDTNHCCVTCRGNFPSKNKLFDHLKKTRHGVYIPPN